MIEDTIHYESPRLPLIVSAIRVDPVETSQPEPKPRPDPTPRKSIPNDPPAKPKPTPAKRKPTPAKRKSAPAKRKPTPAKRKSAPAKRKSAPAKRKSRPCRPVLRKRTCKPRKHKRVGTIMQGGKRVAVYEGPRKGKYTLSRNGCPAYLRPCFSK